MSKGSLIIKDGSSVWELLGFGVVVFAFSTMSGFDREVINYLTSYIIIGLSKSFPLMTKRTPHYKSVLYLSDAFSRDMT